jgi:predicted N-acetyltransferase YhbS
MGFMKIRRIPGEERLTTSRPLLAYAFEASPMTAEELERLRQQPVRTADVTLVAEDDAGTPLATASSTPMRQNVRGRVYPMAGVCGVASHPLARRQGLVRNLLVELLGQVRDEGCAVSTLYPFRPSFYERFGYVGLPQTRTVTVSPADLSPYLRAPLPGEIAWQRVAEGYPALRALTEELLTRRHGFAILGEERALRLRERDEHWLVTALLDGVVVGAATYRIAEFGGELVADHLLASDALGRALLLGFFARHVDQVARVVVTVAPDEAPELWATDLATHTESKTAWPSARAPMARVLSVDGLAGLPVGTGRADVEIVDDPFIAGRYRFDGGTGALEITRAGTGTGVATLTAAGFSALVYGALDPIEVTVRGLGTVPAEAVEGLRTLFPRRTPYVFSEF